jgi:hypothetical protein
VASRSHIKLHWEHDRDSHEDYTVDCPWGTYYKLQAVCDDRGFCSGGKNDYYSSACGRPWSNQIRGQFWCRFVDTAGHEEWVSSPGSVQSEPYAAYLRHKKRMLIEGE